MRNVRHLILHYHIFKNAGSTIDAILKKKFHSNWAVVEGRPSTYRLETDELVKYILGNPHLLAVSSHEARPPVPVSPNLKFYPIIFFRHPIDRIGSIYSYRRSQLEILTRSTKVAHEMDMAGYIRWCLENPSAETVINFQTRYLSVSEKNPRGMADFELAMQRLLDAPFFGLVEYFDESLKQLKNYLFGTFGDMDFGYKIMNRSPNRLGTLKERLAHIEYSLGDSLYEELLGRNALDLQLYEQAIKIFESRMLS